MDEKKELQKRLRELREEYKYEKPDIFESDDINIRKIKWIVENKLSIFDNTIFLLYCETGSLRKLGSMLGLSHSTVRPVVKRIKEDIKEELIKMKDINNI